eukprot:TRINITY_DN12164_c0_g1_i2.p1 TRINITY_DN12164_c0_g1~~TRINITY_DN12164_c0_g1_i2.p1  ORF type:complete len:562 (-),score=113.19 TRINITY_DN12164_c0_g1_i2:146-1831(-)
MEGNADPVDSSDSEAHLPPQQRKKRQRFKRHRGRRQRRRLRELQAQLDGERKKEEESTFCKLGLDCFAAPAAHPCLRSESIAAALPNEVCFAATAADPFFSSEGIAAPLPNEAAPRPATWPDFDPEDGEPVCRTPSPPDSPRHQLLPMVWPGQPAPLQKLINVVYVEVPSADGNFRCFVPQQVVSCSQWSGHSSEDHGERYTVPPNAAPVMSEPSTWALESGLRPEDMHSASSGLIASSSDTSMTAAHATSAEAFWMERHDAGTASFEASLASTTQEQVGIGVDNQEADSFPSLETTSSHSKSSPNFASPRSSIDEPASEEERSKIIESKWLDKTPATPASPSCPDSADAKHAKTLWFDEHEEKTSEMHKSTPKWDSAKQGACEGGSDGCTSRRQSVRTPQSRWAHPSTPWTKLVLVAAAVAAMTLVAVGSNLLAGFFSLALTKSNSAEPGCTGGSPRQPRAGASVEAFEPGGRPASSRTHSMKLSAPIVVIPMEAGPAFEPSKAKVSSMDQSSWTKGVSSVQQYADFPTPARPSQMKLSEPVVLLPEARWNNSPLRVEDD